MRRMMRWKCILIQYLYINIHRSRLAQVVASCPVRICFNFFLPQFLRIFCFKGYKDWGLRTEDWGMRNEDPEGVKLSSVLTPNSSILNPWSSIINPRSLILILRSSLLNICVAFCCCCWVVHCTSVEAKNQQKMHFCCRKAKNSCFAAKGT